MTASPISLPVEVDRPLPSGEHRRTGPATIVIFGGGGDLTRRKLIPALYHLFLDGVLHPELRVLALGREERTDESFRHDLLEALRGSGEPGARVIGRWGEFAPRLAWVRGDLREAATFGAIGERLERRDAELGSPAGRMFYLAIPPTIYATTIQALARSGIAPRRHLASDPGWVRIVIEKPFGRSGETARDLNRLVRSAFAEHQVYRIDHYLGKETVQNLLVFRFANSILEPIWNRNHIHDVQITAAEQLGVEHRAGYYEDAGVVRDMVQNHLLQLLALTAMEPPAEFRADAVRDEKTKVIRAVRPFDPSTLTDVAVLGQYGPGSIEGAPVPGYREEEGVADRSATPTFAAIRFQIDNWRWQGVPFVLRSGKRMARRVTEIAIRFREPPLVLFPNHGRDATPNVLAIEIQPEEGLSLCFDIKVPGAGMRTTAARMDFSYDTLFGGDDHSAYETLLLDCMLGDATLFIRNDTTEAAWQIVDPILEASAPGGPLRPAMYPAGSWGPEAADRLIERAGGTWRNQ